MSYNKFLISIIIRVILISINCFLFGLIMNYEGRLFTLIALLIILIGQIYYLYKYVSSTNKGLANFLLSLSAGDTTIDFSNYEIEKIFKGLGKSYSKIIKETQKIQREKEEKENFIQSIVDHITIGIITFNKNGKVFILNKSAKQILGINDLFNIFDLEKVNKDLSKLLLNLKPGKRLICKLSTNKDFKQLSIISTTIKLKDEEISLVSIQDIKNELEENELKSYQNLIRIINHEMMNSLTPITTLTASIKRNFSKNNVIKELTELDFEDIEDAVTSSELIEDRTNGLINFIQSYRELTKLSKAKLSEQNIENLFQKIKTLFQTELKLKEIELNFDINPNELTILLDSELTEQAMINLVKNAIEAFGAKNNKQIILKAYNSGNGNKNIEIIDNGKGIDKDQISDIFIPFFSSKQEGSGIGLSICRQIMRLHKGSINVHSELGKGSKFILEF